MKRKLNPAIREKAIKIASIVGAIHTLNQNIEQSFAESDVDDDDFELSVMSAFICNTNVEDELDNPEDQQLDEDVEIEKSNLQRAGQSISRQRYRRSTRLGVNASGSGDNMSIAMGKDSQDLGGDYQEVIAGDTDDPFDGEEILKKYAKAQQKSVQHQTTDNSSNEILLLFSLDDFRKQFGVQQRTFEVIGQLVAPYTQKASAKIPGRAQIPAEKQLLISLWLLVNQESFKDVGARFAVCRKTAWQCLHRVVRSLVKINQERSVIQWPSLDKAGEIIDGFNEISGIPGVMGVIDSVHIPIKAPPVAPDVYANSKGSHSVILQAVCDSKMQFIDCYIGEGGSTEDAVVLSRSPLQQIMGTPQLFPPNCHLIGETVYPLQTHLLTAYEPFETVENDDIIDACNDNQNTREQTELQRYYNECVYKCMNVIHQTFAAVKGRFRRLCRLEMSRVDKIPETIMACCVLHNICIQLDDAPDEADLLNACRDDRPASLILSSEREEAIIKRDEIASTLFIFRTKSEF